MEPDHTHQKMDRQQTIIDSHCHFDSDAFDLDRDAVLHRAHAAGIRRIISPAVTAKSWPQLRKISSQYPGISPCYGLHPMFLDEHSDTDIDHLNQWVEQEKPIAIGEIGLDFYLKDLDREKQAWFFEQQLKIAGKFHLPVIIHARKSTEHVVQTLRQHPKLKGIVHSYSGSLDQAKLLAKQGFMLGFGGPVTWEGSRKLHRLIEALPLESMVLETDAPDQTGQAHRGQRNEPSFIVEVAEQIARLKKTSVDEVIRQTRLNTEKVLNL